MVGASRWSVALRAFYRQILSLTYSFFSLKLPPPACPGTTGMYIYNIYIYTRPSSLYFNFVTSFHSINFHPFQTLRSVWGLVWTLEPIDLPINSWISVPEGRPAPFSGRVPVSRQLVGWIHGENGPGDFPRKFVWPQNEEILCITTIFLGPNFNKGLAFGVEGYP